MSRSQQQPTPNEFNEPELTQEDEVVNEACNELGRSYSLQVGDPQGAINPIFGELLGMLAKFLMGWCQRETETEPGMIGAGEIQARCAQMVRRPLLTRRQRIRMRGPALDFLAERDPDGRLEVDEAIWSCIRAGATASPQRLQAFMDVSF